jgi:CheY-like chemotaxis protein
MEAVGRLAGGVAHDFNNLLMVVLNSARFLQEDLKSDPARLEDVDQIIDAGERAAVLVRQLLAYSRKQIVSPKVVSLNDIVGDMKTLLERTIGEDVALLTRLADDLWLTEVDPHQMEQVILNLVVNARDWMPKGGTVSIETSNVFIDDESARLHGVAKAGEFVCLAISDTGIGIDKTLLKQIFEPFFSTKPMSDGTGLGLSMVYGIVTQAGGQVVASSEAGMGSTFRVYLPTSLKDLEPRQQPPQRVAGRGVGRTILVAEDDEQVCEITTRILARNGFDVIYAHSGDAALALARKHAGTIDVLLTDIVMPRMSGRELASRVRLLSPDTRIVYMSGYTADIIGRHGILDVDENYLPKPFTADQLFEHIERALR